MNHPDRRLVPIVLLAGAAISPAAHGQSMTTGSTIAWTINWEEAPGGNNNGVLEPGESALLSLSVAFTNQFTVANFTPPIGTFGSGTIRGFAWGGVDLRGAGGTEGDWAVDPVGTPPHGLRPGWDPGGRDGMPANNGADLLDIEPGQIPQWNSGLMTTNPVAAIWTGLWTPRSYANRVVAFQIAPNSVWGTFNSAVAVRLSGILWTEVYTPAEYGLIAIPVGVPAPNAAAVLAAAAIGVGSRRRRSR